MMKVIRWEESVKLIAESIIMQEHLRGKGMTDEEWCRWMID